jgi:hypothetical protein
MTTAVSMRSIVGILLVLAGRVAACYTGIPGCDTFLLLAGGESIAGG